MEIGIKFTNKKHYKYIDNSRKAAIIINEDKLIVVGSHKDFLEFIYDDIEDDEL